MWESETK